jgi:hypothetical protein
MQLAEEFMLYISYTDKKKILIYQEIQMGAVANFYIYEEGLPNI